MLKAALAGLVLSVSGFANAGLILHNSGTATTFTLSNFNEVTFSFSSEFVDTISLANFGGGYIHTHAGTLTQSTIDIFDGTNWLNVFTSSIAVSQANLSTIYTSPITFTGLNISGLRLSSTIFQNQSYHNVNSSMSYTLSGTAVPEPSTLAIFALGIIGLASRRFKKQ